MLRRHVGQAEPRQRRVADLENAVEDKLALHARFQLPAILLESQA